MTANPNTGGQRPQNDFLFSSLDFDGTTTMVTQQGSASSNKHELHRSRCNRIALQGNEALEGVSRKRRTIFCSSYDLDGEATVLPSVVDAKFEKRAERRRQYNRAIGLTRIGLFKNYSAERSDASGLLGLTSLFSILAEIGSEDPPSGPMAVPKSFEHISVPAFSRRSADESETFDPVAEEKIVIPLF